MTNFSKEQINFKKGFVEYLRYQTPVDDETIVACLRTWGWDVGSPNDYFEKETSLNETTMGPGEQYLRSQCSDKAQAYITQARYIIGKGYDNASIEPLRIVTSNGKGIDPKDRDKVDSLYDCIVKQAGNSQTIATLAWTAARILPWSDPQGLVDIISKLNPMPAGWTNSFSTALAEAQPPAWFRWLKRPIAIESKNPPTPISEDEAKIIFSGMQLNKWIVYDRFTGVITWIKDYPLWLVKAGDEFIDKDYITVQRMVNLTTSRFRAKISLTTVRNTLKSFCREFYYDSPQAWLKSLPQWDGKKRIESLLAAMNTRTDQLHQNMFFWWACQFVNRITKPGCQADYMLLLIGEQGERKTSILDRFGLNKWTGKIKLNELIRGNTNTVSRKLQGKVIVNIDEWGGIKRQDREAVKTFISDTFDEFDVKWQEKTEKGLRRFALSGTTNIEEAFSDPTGARRYFPFTVTGYITDEQLAFIEVTWPLIVAEVRARMEAGEQCYPNPEQRKEIQVLQEGEYTEQSEATNHVHVNLDELILKRKVTAFTLWEVYSLRCKGTALNDRYESFIKDKALEHSLRESIKTWRNDQGIVIDKHTKPLNRDDGKYRHYVLVGVSKHTYLSNTQEYRDMMENARQMDNLYTNTYNIS